MRHDQASPTPAEMRRNTAAILDRLNIQVPASLPFLDANLRLRRLEEIIARALVLSASVAVACGFPRERATHWLDREELLSSLSDQERSFLVGGVGNEHEVQVRVESLCVFAWSLGLLEQIEFTSPCPSSLVTLYPDLKRMEPADDFRGRARLRDAGEMLQMLDLGYCLHWAFNEAMLMRRAFPPRISPVVVIERRRALEWMFGDEDWDEVSLDT